MKVVISSRTKKYIKKGPMAVHVELQASCALSEVEIVMEVHDVFSLGEGLEYVDDGVRKYIAAKFTAREARAFASALLDVCDLVEAKDMGVR